MNRRCLHITIHDDSTAASRRARPGASGRRESDPGTDYHMPKTDDPGTDYHMPKTDDPGTDYHMPKTDDPSSGGWGASGGGGGAGGGCGWGAVVATACCCGCAPAGPSAATPGTTTAPNPFVTARDYSGFVIVRLAPGIEHSEATSLWSLAKKMHLTGLQTVLEKPGETDGGARVIMPPPVTDPSGGGAVAGRTAVIGDQRDDEKRPPEEMPPEGTLVSRPLVELRIEARPRKSVRATCLERIHELENAAALSPFPPRYSLVAYWRVDLRPVPGFEEEVVARLNRLAEVDLAYRELVAVDPAAGIAGELLQDDQGYFDDAPVGIGAAWAWKRLSGLLAAQSGTSTQRQVNTVISQRQQSTPTNLVIFDVEQGWTTNHVDLAPLSLKNLAYGANRAEEGGSTGDHGTAVVGQVAAAGISPFGIRGAATGIAQIRLASHYRSKDEKETVDKVTKPHPFAGTNGHVAAAITQALSVMSTQPGGIVLLEVQRGLLPTEVDEADFDAIRLASGLAVLVVEAAGNGGFDLDAWSEPTTHRSLNRGTSSFRDSGAVLVGAARAALPHDRAPFSNYGSRVDCFGWGEAVTTCGFGDLAGKDATDAYTNSFNGTSSAAPIIAGAAALLQTLHQTATGTTLSPGAMRALLSDPATGTRQGPNVPGAIGVMPDLEAILRRSLQLLPVVYLRRAPGDDGSVPGASDDVSSSPDIFVWSGNLTQTKARYEGVPGLLRDNVPAPGDLVTANAQNLYLRLRNRGLNAGGVQVQLFASPAATLITPERWIPIPIPPNGFAGLPVNDIPQGGLPVIAGPVAWTPPSSTVAAWSFLAVLRQPDEGPAAPPVPFFFDWPTGLPPGPPYFRWNEFRAFLRRPGVAWRNVHRIPSPGAMANLVFVIAGTPESAHVFDFEVIQRLPAGATVKLHVPAALGAKLRQRQPWLSGSTSPMPLPARPKLKIRGVELAAGTYADATFTVQGAGLQPGHSLAIRQLWRGEVVGGITWVFGPEP